MGKGRGRIDGQLTGTERERHEVGAALESAIAIERDSSADFPQTGLIQKAMPIDREQLIPGRHEGGGF